MLENKKSIVYGSSDKASRGSPGHLKNSTVAHDIFYAEAQKNTSPLTTSFYAEAQEHRSTLTTSFSRGPPKKRLSSCRLLREKRGAGDAAGVQVRERRNKNRRQQADTQ